MNTLLGRLNTPYEERPAIRGIYHLLLGSTISFAITAISSIAVARLLGPASYGLYGLALVMPSYLSAFDLNASASAVRFSAKFIGEGDRTKAVSFGYSMLIFQLIISLISFLISIPLSGVVAAYFLKRSILAEYFPIAAASILGVGLINVSSGALQGLGDMRKSAMSGIAQSLTRLFVSVGLILFGLSVLGAVIGYTAGYIAGGLAGFAFVIYSYRAILPKGFLRDVRVAISYSLPLYTGTMISVFVSPYASTLLANFVSNAQIGGYSAASNLVQAVAVTSSPISMALFPLFSRLDKKSDDIRNAYRNSVKYASLLMVPITFAIIALAEPIISVVYGERFDFAALYLIVLVAPNLFVGIGSLALGAFLNGIGEVRKSMYAGISSTITYIAATTILVPFFNVYGLAMSSALSTVAGIAVATKMMGPIFGKGILVSSVSRIYIASAATAGLVYLIFELKIPNVVMLVVGIFFFLAIYVPLLAIASALKQDEVSTLREYFSSSGLLSIPLTLLLRYYEFFYRIIH